MDIGPPEWIIIGIVLLLLFGSSKIPELARNLGRAQSELKRGLAEGRKGPCDDAVSTPDPASAAAESATTSLASPSASVVHDLDV